MNKPEGQSAQGPASSSSSAPPRIGPRTELKFIVAEEAADRVFAAFRPQLAPDPHAKNPDDASYRIESLYFDTANFDCYRRRGMDGLSKYRLRRYDGADDRLFLEEKLRRGNVVWKRRLILPRYQITAVTQGRETLEGEAEWFRRRFRVLDLQPQLVISYRREALVGKNGERLTIDREIQGRLVDLARWADDPFAQAAPSFPVLEPGMAVFEIKHPGEAQTFEADAMAVLGLPVGACSKYARGIEAAGIDL